MDLHNVEKVINRSQPQEHLISSLAIYRHDDEKLYLHVDFYAIDPQTLEWSEKESARHFTMPMSNFSQNLVTADDLICLVDVLDNLVAG